MIEEVAREADEEMPAEVYLAPDVSAALTVRGGFLGRDELRGVLGHHVGQDARLGPVELREEGPDVEPFNAIGAAIEGQLSPEDWRARCEEAGVAELPLQPPSADRASATVNLPS